MEITEGIQQLLHRNDIVSLPRLGTFRGSYRSATIHPTQHLFEPPHKAISFDDAYIDDGLLSHYLSAKNNLSPETTTNTIYSFVHTLQNELELNGETAIKGIGIFKYDIEKQLHFIQDETENYLNSSYGLDQFISHPILRRNEPQGKSLKKKKEKVIAIAKANSILLWLLMALGFAAIAAVYFIYKSGIIDWWHS